MKKLAVFCSGGGTNFQSVIDASEAKTINAKIVALVASKDGIYAIERAKKHNIPHFVFDKNDYSSLEAMYEKITKQLKGLGVDLIVFAGYLTLATPNFISEYRNKIVNIHPSLLPKYGGKGFYGKKVHEAVIAAKEQISGCSVHYVDEGADTGKILAQKEVPVLPGDTADILQKRVLGQEHDLLVQVIRDLSM